MPKVVAIGWHGADWKTIHPLVDKGRMPNLRALIERGVIGTVRPAGSVAPAIVYTTIATGRHTADHGVLSSTSIDPWTGAVCPASQRERRVKALWDIARQSGLASFVVGWPANERTDTVAGAFRPDELTGNELLPFIPELSSIDQESDGRVVAFADILARTVATHAVSTGLLENSPWNLAMITWDGLERASFAFQRYTEPCLSYVDETDCKKYGKVIEGMYCFYDMLLGRIVQLAGAEASVLLVSASGFRVGAERPVASDWRDRPAAWLRPQGMFCLASPNVRRDELVYGATPLDFAPTILALLGLPAAADMPGRVLKDAFVDSAAPEKPRIPSWEAVGGGWRLEESAEDCADGAREVAALEALGYRESPQAIENREKVERDRQLQLAMTNLMLGRFAEARAAFVELSAHIPRLAVSAAYCSLLLHDVEGCRAILGTIERKGAFGALAYLIDAQLAPDAATILDAVRHALHLGAHIAYVNFIAGALFLRLKRWDDAEPVLRRAVALDPLLRPAHGLLARLLALRGKSDEAVQSALNELNIDHASALSHFTLGLTLFGSGDNDAALAAFERSASFEYAPPEARAWAAALRRQGGR